MTGRMCERVPPGVTLGLWALALVWEHTRARALAMATAQGARGVLTGVGAALIIAGVTGEGLVAEWPQWTHIAGGVLGLAAAALADFISTTQSFGVRWRIQAVLREEVLDRLRNGPAPVLQAPLRAQSAPALACAAGIEAGHAAWFSQLVLNGAVPTLVAAALTIAVGSRDPVLLVPLCAMVVLTVPMLWLQARRVTRAASSLAESAQPQARMIRLAVAAARAGQAGDGIDRSPIDRFEASRRDRLAGVQQLRLGTGILVAVTVGLSAAGLLAAEASPTEVVLFVAMLREALSAIAAVARAVGGAARLFPRADRLRRTLRAPQACGREGAPPTCMAVHAAPAPDTLAAYAALCAWARGRPLRGPAEIDGGRFTVVWARGDGECSVCCSRPDERGMADVRLAITGDGAVVEWDPDAPSGPAFDPPQGSIHAPGESEAEDDEEAEG